MILPDVNTLIYAFRKDSLQYRAYSEWLEAVVNGDSDYGISPQVLCSVVRISTNPRVFKQPSERSEALEFCATLLKQENCHLIQPGRRHWPIFVDLCQKAQASGNLIQDAWFAALAIEHGCEWVTSDREYARFPGLHWYPPFDR
ncbi:MAG TPA: type II toxin-antitoxin system VapC family toxin [Terriglobia bacterium]|nr:type II toxin-antitoxin system VapC family toxin [Terriglobia bacterium]